MALREARGAAERPLQDVVLCFTSVGPEDRTRYADIAIQMGAEHKLDLTSDTTHLIVGSTDSLKYQYVAKERDDIKVLRPEWVEAVRDRWIKDLPLDLDELIHEYRLPTLAGLKICITGFDDLSFRAQLQKNVVDNGGEYTGDLTKDVTHLIAARPEGKKYEYGMQWQKKVVSIKWYRDTLDRGMQLDEKMYHPTLPTSEQGVGAWNRRIKPTSTHLGKRARGESLAPEPSRKLRRTASARLGSQNQDMWSDIVGGAGFEARPAGRRQLKPSISMPTMQNPDTFAHASINEMSEPSAGSVANNNAPNPLRFLSDRHFIIKGFDEKKERLLHKILLEHGGTVVDQQLPEACEMDHTFLLLPHDLSRDGSVPPGLLYGDHQAVSELWLERCMLHKTLVPPDLYPLGLVLSGSLIGALDLTINATGFDALETLHISKIVTLLGGKYAQVFTSTVSLLVCSTGDTNKQKLELAEHSSIPAVSEDWLWATLRQGRRAKIEDYLIKRTRPPNDQATIDRRTISKDYVEVSTIPIRRDLNESDTRQISQETNKGEYRKKGGESKKHADPSTRVHQDTMDVEGNRDSLSSTHASGGSDDSNTQAGSDVPSEHVLKELSSNSSGRRVPPAGGKDTSLRSLDGASSVRDAAPEANGQNEEQGQNRTQQADGPRPSNVAAINGAIREMLDQSSRQKSANNGTGSERVRKSRLVGRALSNLSNSSLTSNMRPSRASSVDSINTDGIGSEIVTTMQSDAQGGETLNMGEKMAFNFTGRAKTTLAGFQAGGAFEANDLDLGKSGFETEPEAPQMTQLGYEDPEEAILLREKLAESRRKRITDGQAAEESKPAARAKLERKIQDDDIFAGAGWGTGRRTRQKQRDPAGQGIQEF